MTFQDWRTKYNETKMPEKLKSDIRRVLHEETVKRPRSRMLAMAPTFGAAIAGVLLVAGIGVFGVHHAITNPTIPAQSFDIGQIQPASVVVYPPSINAGWGPAPTLPTIDTAVQPVKGKVRQLKVDISLNANQKSVTFQPVTLHIDNAPGNGSHYTVNYIVTSGKVHLDSSRSKHLQLNIPVPPKSGSYTIMADSPTYNPSVRRELINIVYVNHGGFYRSGVIKTNQHEQRGDVGMTVTGVEMTNAHTRILFYLTGRAAKNQSQQWGNQDEVVQQVLKNGKSVYSMNLGWSLGSLLSTARQCTWDADPTRSDASAIKFDFQLLMQATSGGTKTYKFSFRIPLSK